VLLLLVKILPRGTRNDVEGEEEEEEEDGG
jgi:hypothetical protein